MRFLALLLASTSVAFAQKGLWEQCGGQDYTGPTTCVAGACCVYSSQWYSQCLPGSCSSSSASSSRSTTRSTTYSSTTIRTSTTTSQTTTRSSTTTARSSTPVSSSTTTRSTTTSRTTTSSAAVSTFTNPIVYQDYPDNDVFLGPDGYYYLSASNFHFSPGAPILRSRDLQNWETVGHSIPTLDFGDNYSLIGNQAYRRGTWASSMRYRASTQTWYWVGCIDFWNSFIYTSSSPSGPWVRSASLWARCYYDCGLFIDDDDTMYVVHGNENVNVTQLAPNGLSEVQTQQIATNPPGFAGMEGNRMYKRNGIYYILNDSGSGAITWIWKSNSPWGPWTSKVLQQGSGGPIPGGNTPHQGSLVKTPGNDWFFISFSWSFPLGRIPVIAPVTWGADDYPILGLVGGNWSVNYPNPLPSSPTPSWTGTDLFPGTTLSTRWEWNHNPDTTKYSVNNGVTLQAATVTNDLFLARNTLVRRLVGSQPVATILLDFNSLADGDRAGLSAFKDRASYIGVARNGSSYSVVVRSGLTLSTTDWSTTSIGSDVASTAISKGNGRIWFRGRADARAASPDSTSRLVTYEYSLDGTTFTSLGAGYILDANWYLFMGYRWGIFNHATVALGGSVKLLEFTQL